MGAPHPPTDNEVYQSVGAGPADWDGGEGQVHLRDGSGERGLHHQHQGAEQRRIPGPGSVLIPLIHVLVINWLNKR